MIDTIKHFESLQRRYKTTHNDVACKHVENALNALRELAQVKRERDAAVHDINHYGRCGACRRYPEMCGASATSCCVGGFGWRGVCDDNTKENEE